MVCTSYFLQVLRAVEEEDAVGLVSRCLPNVVPNVLLNKREVALWLLMLCFAVSVTLLLTESHSSCRVQNYFLYLYVFCIFRIV